jgi:hypothetical protein
MSKAGELQQPWRYTHGAGEVSATFPVVLK